MWFSFTRHIPEIKDSNLTNIKFFLFPAKGPHTSTNSTTILRKPYHSCGIIQATFITGVVSRNHLTKAISSSLRTYLGPNLI